jgi:hypothetical protein
VQPPQTQYVERDGVSIAYQVVGDGPVDMLLAPGFISHLDLQGFRALGTSTPWWMSACRGSSSTRRLSTCAAQTALP